MAYLLFPLGGGSDLRYFAPTAPHSGDSGGGTQRAALALLRPVRGAVPALRCKRGGTVGQTVGGP